MSEKILITSALPYANGPLHFGHIAGAYLPGDCYARFQRLKGRDVLYICGSDEYGVAITMSAEKAGRTPKEHVDLFHAINQDLFKKLNFSFDHYSRTTWSGHTETTQEFFKDLYDNGYIEEKVTDQLYSPADNKFLADRYVVGTCPRCRFESARGDECPKCGASYEATDLINPRSKATNAPLVKKPTNHWFLRFDMFKDRLKTFLDEKKWKENVVNFAENYINDLRPRAITRDSDWGVPVPLKEADGKVLYVWFDAPIGYISATKEWAKKNNNDTLWEKYWLDPSTKLVHFIGKDNIPFHAVFFPAMIMGQNKPYKLVDELPANEFFLLEGKQFSKSDGWYIDLERFFENFSADQIRYTIAANAPENQDAEFTWKDFQNRCNAELLGKLGNFVNRTLVFALSKCEGKVPGIGTLEEIDKKFLEDVKRQTAEIAECYEHFKLRKAAQHLMELAQIGNVYFDAKKPWADAKSESTIERMYTTIGCCVECLKCLALVSSPIIPDTAEKIWKMLGFTYSLSQAKWDQVVELSVEAGQKLPQPEILMKKVEDTLIEEEINLLKGKSEALPQEKAVPQKEIAPLKPFVAIDDVRKLDLRVGRILQAERVAKSKKLLKLTVDIGLEVRTIVSGIGHTVPDLATLIDQKVVVVANLQPATLMGVESQGMLLAGDTVDSLELLKLKDCPVGACVS